MMPRDIAAAPPSPLAGEGRDEGAARAARQTPPRTRLAKGGPLARRAAIACGTIPFRTFLWKVHGLPAFTTEAAADAVRRLCGGQGQPLASRADLDHDAEAAARWRALSKAYERWRREEGR